MDWNSIFVPSLHLSELILRGTVMYLALFFILRFFRRQSGATSIADFLVIVLIADAAQNGLSSHYTSIPEGLVLVGTIVFWDMVLDFTAYRVPALRSLLKAPALTLIQDSQPMNDNLRKLMIDQQELLSHLRQHGVERLDDVRLCVLEEDGHISVISRNKPQAKQPPTHSMP